MGVAREPVVIGVDHGRASVAFRERLAFAGPDLAEGLRRLPAYVPEGAILSTCNRTEVYAAVERGDHAPTALRRFLAETRGVAEGDLDRVAYLHHGPDAVRHLDRVAAGLESLVIGEPQILGQLRDALDAARAAGAAGPVVSRLLTEALRVGKRARTETGIARNRRSVPHAAVDHAAALLGGLGGRGALVVGAGEMATLSAKLLRAAGVADLVVANRGEERGAALATLVGGRGVPLAALGEVLPGVDVAVAAAAAPGYLVDAGKLGDSLAGRATPLVLIDLAVPRVVDPALGAHPLVRLVGVDDLADVAAAHRARHAAEAEKSEAIVEEAVAAFGAWLAGRDAAPTAAALKERAEAVRRAELESALRKLGHLSERDREVVAALSVGIANKLVHAPLSALRREADRDELGRAARRLFALETGDGAVEGGETPRVDIASSDAAASRSVLDGVPATAGRCDRD
jgi:glutamyl-tRNA reductase